MATCSCTPLRCIPAGCANQAAASLGAGAAELQDNPAVTTGSFTGGDPGEGHVDFEGDFVLAVNVRSLPPARSPSLIRRAVRVIKARRLAATGGRALG